MTQPPEAESFPLSRLQNNMIGTTISRNNKMENIYK